MCLDHINVCLSLPSSLSKTTFKKWLKWQTFFKQLRPSPIKKKQEPLNWAAVPEGDFGPDGGDLVEMP